MTRPAAPPQFATVLRGYDREQVDEYVAALQHVVREAQERAAASQRVVDGSRAGRPAGGVDDPTDALVLTPTALAVQGLPQRLAQAVLEALEAAERAGQAALSEVEQERASLTEQARTAREQARQEADALVGQAHDEADRLVREATDEADRHGREATDEADRRLREAAELADRRVVEAEAEAEELVRRGREQDRRAQLAAEDELTAVRQRAEQEQARHDHIVRQIEVLRQWLDAPARPDQGGLALSLFGSEQAADRAAQPVEAAPAQPAEAAPARLDLDEVERDRVERQARQHPVEDGPVQEAATDVLEVRPAPASRPAEQATGEQATGEQDADPYGDRTQVLRIPE